MPRLFVREAWHSWSRETRRNLHHNMFRSRFAGTLTFGGDLTKASAEALVDNGEVAAALFGRPFIANPDLVERFRQDAPLNTPDRAATFYHTPGRRAISTTRPLADLVDNLGESLDVVDIGRPAYCLTPHTMVTDANRSV